MSDLRKRILHLAAALKVQKFKYYHITGKDLGASFTMKPIVPNVDATLKDEDTTTPRSCFADDVEGCVAALGVGFQDSNEYEERFHPNIAVLYGANKLEGYYNPATGEGVKPKNTKKDRFKYKVHDAAGTGEVWACKPTRVQRVGIVKFGHDPTQDFRVYAYDAPISTKMLAALDKYFDKQSKKKVPTTPYWERLPKLRPELVEVDKTIRAEIPRVPTCLGSLRWMTQPAYMAAYKGKTVLLGVWPDLHVTCMGLVVDNVTPKHREIENEIGRILSKAEGPIKWDSAGNRIQKKITPKQRIAWLKANFLKLLAM